MGQSSTNADKKSTVFERSEKLQEQLHNLLREKQEARRRQEQQLSNRGGPVLKRLRVANCSAFRSASSSARPIVVCPTASSSTKDKCVENGCFLCPWSECVKQPAKSGYKSFDELEMHMGSVDCSRKGAWNPRFWHTDLRRLWRLYGPEHVASPAAIAASVPLAPEAISNTIAANTKKQHETEKRLREIVRQEVSQLLQPLVEEVTQLRRLVSRHTHTNEERSKSGQGS